MTISDFWKVFVIFGNPDDDSSENSMPNDPACFPFDQLVLVVYGDQGKTGQLSLSKTTTQSTNRLTAGQTFELQVLHVRFCICEIFSEGFSNVIEQICYDTTWKSAVEMTVFLKILAGKL